MPEGKIVIITGASSGIGLATSKAFLSAGWRVFGIDVSPAPPPDLLFPNSNSSPTSNTFQFLQTDLTQPSAPKSIVAACQTAFGPKIDALINVAGILDHNSAVDNLLDDDWERTIAVNLTAPVRLMREVVGVMKEHKEGCIVNVSSKAGLSGAVAGVAYTASKHGLIGVTKNTAWLLKDDGIRCNAICPGAVATNIGKNIDRTKWDMTATMRMKPVQETHWDPNGSKPVADPSVAADTILFLASDASRGINGALVPVDNAWSVI
ncbi:hypothetical protein D9758_006468 [Tetrapyrgos nigripes]|uniref:Uncharacterized protein n=1 Tax=Tetrapyrgos nigripes TaxID=182062 RepID=A0A8H5GKQ1_9AGAR|nr:hypothetical protein D9758_006468 [Tetrapyrgos nigripes]